MRTLMLQGGEMQHGIVTLSRTVAHFCFRFFSFFRNQKAPSRSLKAPGGQTRVFSTVRGATKPSAPHRTRIGHLADAGWQMQMCGSQRKLRKVGHAH